MFGIYCAANQLHFVVYALIGVFVVGGTTGTALLTARRITRRLELLGSAAQQVGQGNFKVRVPIEGGDEIARLDTDFNAMASELEAKATRFNELDTLKSEFVSRVSHELRTPLTTIKALTRLLIRGEVGEEKQREYFETISIECDRQIDLILNLLDLSRIEGGVFRLAMERVEVEDVITSCVKAEIAAAERRGHKIQVKPFADIPPVCADPKTLRRVVSNLIENSIKYTPDGGLIVLSADEEKNYVAIRVTDNGRGIPPEDLPVLFDKFHRGRPAPHSAVMTAAATDEEFLDDADVSGVGLGLYLARDVMERMGGRISVETKVGQGSTFTLQLPFWNAAGCGKSASEVKENGETIASS
ncbi:MAG TPA: HAMP domain-containing sensor histidine kinase [Pyrinomonadaceae bacterium]|nr:HAMP domain-containing sensor histidine kinase [Pyrinomonadaceae bacterium]